MFLAPPAISLKNNDTVVLNQTETVDRINYTAYEITAPESIPNISSTNSANSDDQIGNINLSDASANITAPQPNDCGNGYSYLGSCGCLMEWLGLGGEEWIPGGGCSNYYLADTGAAPYCNPQNFSLEEKCSKCKCFGDMPCTDDDKCERYTNSTPPGAIGEGKTGEVSALPILVKTVYSAKKVDIMINDDFITLNQGVYTARRFGNMWYANITLISRGFFPTMTNTPGSAISWAILNLTNFTSDCIKLDQVDKLRVRYFDTGWHTRREIKVSMKKDDKNNWQMQIQNADGSKSDFNVSEETSAIGVNGSDITMSFCAIDPEYVYLKLQTTSVLDFDHT